MPEIGNSTAIVPSDALTLTIKEFDAAGAARAFAIEITDNIDPRKMSMKLRAFVLKGTSWKQHSLATIVAGIAYADSLGLDIMAGDVYLASEGRFSTTAGAKIKHAMASGRIAGYSVDITDGPPITIPMKSLGKYEGPNYKARVTVRVKDWPDPVIYETTLAEWFLPGSNNPNWKDRPTYMLRKNALSKALEEIAPMGVEADEAPPLLPSVTV